MAFAVALALPYPVGAGEPSSPQPSVEAALQAYRSGALHQALKGFLLVLSADPKNTTARRYVSQISHELAQQTEGTYKGERGIMLDRAKRLMTEQQERLLQSQQALERDDFVSTIELLWRAQEVDSTSEKVNTALEQLQRRLTTLASPSHSAVLAERLRAQGALLYLNRKWHVAMKAWQEALPQSTKSERLRQDIAKADRYLQAELQRERADLLAIKGADLFQQGHLSQAKAAWEEAIRLAPGHPEAVQGLSRVATEEARRAEQAQLEQLDQHFTEALELYVRGRYADSRKEWRAVLSLHPDHPTAMEYLAMLEQRIGPEKPEKPSVPQPDLSQDSAKVTQKPVVDEHSVPDAIPAVKPAISLPPSPPINKSKSPSAALGTPWKKAPPTDSADAHFTRGVKEQSAQRPQEAIRAFEKALKVDPAHPGAAKALQELRSRIAGSADDHYKQGLIAYSQGRRAEAVKAWRAALAIDPKHPKARRALLKAESEGSRP